MVRFMPNGEAATGPSLALSSAGLSFTLFGICVIDGDNDLRVAVRTETFLDLQEVLLSE